MQNLKNKRARPYGTFFLLLAGLVLSGALLRGKNDWRGEVADLFKKAHDYGGTVVFLEKNLEQIQEEEKAAAIILLCFSYKQLGNTVGEEKWLARYFRHHEPAEPNLDFLTRSDQVKLYEYLGGWKRMYPGIRSVSINREHKRICYFTAPETLKLNIDTRAPCGLEIATTKPASETLYAGYLENGKNTVGLVFKPTLKQNIETPMEIILRSGSIRLKHRLVLNAAFQFPKHVTFDPQSGTIVIKGEQFKKEKTEKTTVETRKYFDRSYFLKKTVPYLAVGSGLILVDRLAIHPAVNRNSASSRSRAFMNGLDKTAVVMGAGISLKGIINLFRSFKTEKKTRTQTVLHKDAMEYNNKLRSRIVQAEKEIYVLFELQENSSNR